MRWRSVAVAALLWCLLASGCALRSRRSDNRGDEGPAPTVSGLTPTMKLDEAVGVLTGQGSTLSRTVEQRERGGRVHELVMLEARGGGLAPFDLELLKARFIDGELSRVEATYGAQLTAEALEEELGPIWSRDGGMMRWFYEKDKAAIEAYRAYSGANWHVTLEVCFAGLEYLSAEAQSQAYQNWWSLVTRGPLPQRNILPPRWVRQSTPEEALWSMARALKERDQAAYTYLLFDGDRAQQVPPMPDIERGRGRTIVALAQDGGARVTMNGDRAVLQGAGSGTVVLKRIRGRWFVQS